ncbi:alpha/beta hydrolase [Pirellulaceae bacterium SH449]
MHERQSPSPDNPPTAIITPERITIAKMLKRPTYLLRAGLLIALFGWLGAVAVQAQDAGGQRSGGQQSAVQQSAVQQSGDQGAGKLGGDGSENRIWVGWIESPESQLRWIIRLTKDTSDWQGAITLPDRTTPPIPLSKLVVSDTALSFSWSPSKGAPEASFVGNVEQPTMIKGLILQGEESIFAQLKKVEKLDQESGDTLGADSVWTDQPSSRAKLLPYDLRMRIYSSGPFFDGTDRVLLDSRTSNVIGAPVKLTQSEGELWSFQIPSLKVEYRAELDSGGDTLSGVLIGSATSKPLQLFKWQSEVKKSEPSPKTPAKKEMASKTGTVETKTKEEVAKADSVKIILDEPSESVRLTAAGDDEFVLTVGSAVGRSRGAQVGHQLGCTLRLPFIEPGQKVPLAVIVSTFDAQDRDGTIGNAKIYQQLAQVLADRGIATLRFDDRGVGKSTIAGPSYNLQEAMSDVKAVLDYGRGLAEVDPGKVGIIGHGFGASLATKLAASDPTMAFLVCLAPPGLDGSKLLLAESEKIAELEELDPESREFYSQLQKEVHALALKPTTNETQMQIEFNDLLDRYWPRMEKIISNSTDSEEVKEQIATGELKISVEEKLRQDLGTMRNSFNRDFLRADPSTSWMIFQTPTLALWGSKDVQVNPEVNLDILKQAMRRNSRSRTQWLVLPGLNHLLQECETGHPAEYVLLDRGISDAALDAITKWLVEQRLASR